MPDPQHANLFGDDLVPEQVAAPAERQRKLADVLSGIAIWGDDGATDERMLGDGLDDGPDPRRHPSSCGGVVGCDEAT